jgi:GH25 family lysozyme M1 (1,4-beta-N-acetylmuramidase)
MINGIDVSSYQDGTYKTAGLDFAFVKATEGTTYVNPKQKAEVDRARKAGLVLGFYHFLHPGHIWAQAAYFVDQCLSVPGDLLVVDWETCPDKNHASNEEKDQFLKIVRELRPKGHKIGLYCNTDYWLNVDKTSGCGDFLWIAAPGVTHPPIRHPWLFWQNGIRGGIDSDLCAFPTRASLKAWAESA